jgi:hypothetical protein
VAAPKTSTKWKDKGGGRTAAIQASRDRTKAQTKPGVDYKEAQKKKAAKGYGGGGGPKKDLVAAGKERIAKMQAMTAKMREQRKKRSGMASRLNPF